MRQRVLWVTTSPLIVNHFLLGHLRALSAVYDVTLAVNTREPYALRLASIDCRLAGIEIVRKISPLRDLAAGFALWRRMRAEGYAAVHSFAPKAGLLAMIAARLAGVPVRLHTFQGEVWATRRGWMRLLLKAADRLSASLATHVLVVGEGEKRFLAGEGVLRGTTGSVLANGSIAGVDLQRFKPDAEARARLRAQLGIDQQATVLLFLGRIARDKGVLDLARAFRVVAASRSQVHLVVAGPDEDALQDEIRAAVQPCAERLHCSEIVETPEAWLAAADLLCLPSYREGFPNVILEAAAVGIPALGSRIYGVSDAILEGRTGALHEPANPADLERKLAGLLDDAPARQSLGQAARERVLRDFDSRQVIAALLAFYAGILARAEEPREPGGDSPQARL